MTKIKSKNEKKKNKKQITDDFIHLLYLVNGIAVTPHAKYKTQHTVHKHAYELI